MSYLKEIWGGILILLFTVFVISMVFGTSRNEVERSIVQADLAGGVTTLQL